MVSQISWLRTRQELEFIPFLQPEHDRTKPGRQIVTFLLICNISMIAIYTFEAQKVIANPVSVITLP